MFSSIDEQINKKSVMYTDEILFGIQEENKTYCGNGNGEDNINFKLYLTNDNYDLSIINSKDVSYEMFAVYVKNKLELECININNRYYLINLSNIQLISYYEQRNNQYENYTIDIFMCNGKIFKLVFSEENNLQKFISIFNKNKSINIINTRVLFT